MRSRPPDRDARNRRRRGNTLVEAALVLVPTLAMLLAVVDFSMAIFLRSTLMHACREGVRYAVTYQTMAGKGHDASIKTVVQSNSIGFLNGTTGLNKIKIRYYESDTFLETAVNGPNNIVEVSVEGYQWGWMSSLWKKNTPLELIARASDRMEGLPGGSQPPAR